MSKSPERYFFEIPVYSCQEDVYYAKRENATCKYLEDFRIRYGGLTREQMPEVYLNAEEHFIEDYG